VGCRTKLEKTRLKLQNFLPTVVGSGCEIELERGEESVCLKKWRASQIRKRVDKTLFLTRSQEDRQTTVPCCPPLPCPALSCPASLRGFSTHECTRPNGATTLASAGGRKSARAPRTQDMTMLRVVAVRRRSHRPGLVCRLSYAFGRAVGAFLSPECHC
jgi:hypothetical protein